MNALVAALALSAGIVAYDDKPHHGAGTLDAAVESYEHLATVIIEVRKTEDAVVKTIIVHHAQAAGGHLQAALGGKDVKKHLEDAATEITNAANEGDKRVQAIRQRLAKAGHTHISDADTKEDYLWISSKEKKGLLAAAKSIAQLGESATPEQITAATKDLHVQFEAALKPEK